MTIAQSLLYPVNNAERQAVSLNGFWDFRLDPEERGEKEGWQEGFRGEKIPVPASFNDFFTDRKIRDYCGDFWYTRKVFVPKEWQGREVVIRFGSATHTAKVFFNGKKVTDHEGGFTPFNAVVTDLVRYGEENTLCLRMNNELSETRLPAGNTVTLSDGRKLAKPNFDFFNYAGLQRNVWLLSLPEDGILDYETTYALDGSDAEVSYRVVTQGNGSVTVTLLDRDGNEAGHAEGTSGTIRVKDAHLWQPRKAYLYTIRITCQSEKGKDLYEDRIGIRTVSIENRRICINGKPVYLKGFGKHEDSDIAGRGYNPVVSKRDFELMKWIGANSFRTSHYPYAEEIYRMADEEGFLVIDESTCVGCFPGLMNLGADRSTVPFFARKTVPELLSHHLQVIDEMIQRDKNHPCVIAWSLLNEPDSGDPSSVAYFERVFQEARDKDPQKRPRTYAVLQNFSAKTDLCHHVADFISLNRYYGWYLLGGSEIGEAEKAFRAELQGWEEAEPEKPIIFTEYGADTNAELDKLPSVMWSESYQIEVLSMCHRVFDETPGVAGEQIWNFADFQTGEGIIRMNGNKKGIFTRQREPKRAAFYLKERWNGKMVKEG